MSNDPYQHHTHNISEDIYHCEQCEKTRQKNETCSDNDVTKDNSSASTSLPSSEHAKNSDDDAAEDDTSTILPLPLPPGEIQLSPNQAQVPTIQGTPQIASAPYTQGTPHLQKSRTEAASTHEPADPLNVQKARQQNHHLESNEQPSSPLSPHPPTMHHAHRRRRLHWQDIHHHMRQIIPIKNMVNIFTLFIVMIICIIIPFFIYLSSHRNGSARYQLQSSKPTVQLTVLQTPVGTTPQPTAPKTSVGNTKHSITPKASRITHHSITPKTSGVTYPPITPKASGITYPPITPKAPRHTNRPTNPKVPESPSSPIPLKAPQLTEIGKLVPGNTIIIRGKYFRPRGMVSFLVDGLPFTEMSTPVRARPPGIRPEAFAPFGFTQVRSSGIETSTFVKSDGAFEKNFVIPMFWLPKSHHTILAFEGSIATPTLASLDITIQDASRPAPNLPACIQASETTLSFSGSQRHDNPAPQSFSLTNCSKAGDWHSQITEQNGGSWLHLDTTEGHMLSSGTKQLTVTTSTGDLQPGVYKGTITFSMATKQLSVVHVTLLVTPPNICVQTTPNALTFSGYEKQDIPPQLLTLKNCGDTGSWWVFVDTADGAHWLSVDTPQGSVEGGQSQQITVRANIMNMSNGTYSGHVYVLLGASMNAQGNTLMAMSEVTVTVTISPPPPPLIR